jgi:hypothetical protein
LRGFSEILQDESTQLAQELYGKIAFWNGEIPVNFYCGDIRREAHFRRVA